MQGLSNTDKILIYGLLGFIAWELWQQTQIEGSPQARCDFAYGNTTPNWIQQLSQARQQQEGGAT